jgi:hypothetical protein
MQTELWTQAQHSFKQVTSQLMDLPLQPSWRVACDGRRFALPAGLLPWEGECRWEGGPSSWRVWWSFALSRGLVALAAELATNHEDLHSIMLVGSASEWLNPSLAGEARGVFAMALQSSALTSASLMHSAAAIVMNPDHPLQWSNAAVAMGTSAHATRLVAWALHLHATATGLELPPTVRDTVVTLATGKHLHSCGGIPPECAPAETSLEDRAFEDPHSTRTPPAQECRSNEWSLAMERRRAECDVHVPEGCDVTRSTAPFHPLRGLLLGNLGSQLAFRNNDGVDRSVARWLLHASLEQRWLETGRLFVGQCLEKMMVLPAVPESVGAIEEDRARLSRELASLMQLRDTLGARYDVPPIVGAMPFALTYHGKDDDRRSIEAYRAVTKPNTLHVAEHVQTLWTAIREQTPTPSMVECGSLHVLARGGDPTLRCRRARVLFVSRFFTLNHPHGMLVRGILGGMRRDAFQVIVGVFLTGSLVVDPSVERSADEVVTLHPSRAIEAIASLRADVIVYLDHLSESTTYTLASHRLAPLQLLFWGNPSTTGEADAIDGFLSADFMEHPVNADQLYSEQLVRMEGQGIWYDALSLPRERRGSVAFGLPPVSPPSSSWCPSAIETGRVSDACPRVLIGCVQSMFKLHPSFDAVVAAVLRALPQATLVTIAERHAPWQAQIERRWRRSMPDVLSRIRVVPRQPNSDSFLDLVASLHVVMHPVPFGGSKTSADVIAMAVPVVVMPTGQLRARMAASFFRSMGLLPLLTRSLLEYVRMTVLLATNASFWQAYRTELRSRSDVIFDRSEVVREWEMLMATALQLPARRDVARSRETPSLPPTSLRLPEWVTQPNATDSERHVWGDDVTDLLEARVIPGVDWMVESQL